MLRKDFIFNFSSYVPECSFVRFLFSLSNKQNRLILRHLTSQYVIKQQAPKEIEYLLIFWKQINLITT